MIGAGTVVTEGEIDRPFTGAQLKAFGRTDVRKDAIYASIGRTATVWPFSQDLKLIGEDLYSQTSNLMDAQQVNLKPYIDPKETEL